MPELRLNVHMMPAAEMGSANPLPVLAAADGAPTPIRVHDNVPQSAREHIGFGCERVCLPYLLQDGYNRQLQPREFKVAVLENQILRATFLLELGGRLWSLWHKPSGRELLYSNPVFRPANLAVRNAWFSGGVEWNAAVPGHTPLTCSPVFAARVKGSDGWPILRLYEWERIRGVPYQLDFSLPDGCPWLLLRVRLTNPHPSTIPMYWWSNIAVPERPDVRVLAPADAAYTFGYADMMKRVPIPREHARDVTYPANLPGSADFFYDIPDQRRPWVAALDARGQGLIQTSTHQQRGRKLFVWGMGPGGNRWQEFLSTPGHRYIEIQAGVARTQFECFPMHAKSELCWMEAYGLMQADPAAVHGSDWARACDEVEQRLERDLPESRLEGLFTSSAADADPEPVQILHRGSGWGALELRRRTLARHEPFCSSALLFDPASLGPEQAPWLELLDHGALPEQDPMLPPKAWMVQEEWRQLLERSLRGRGDHWLSWLHYGVMLHAARRPEEAADAWRQSLKRRPSAWALRNLAVLATHQNQPAEAVELYLQARRLLPTLAPLAIECLQALVLAGRPAELLALIDQLPPAIRKHGRVHVLEARAALDVGDLARSESILLADHLEIPDLREGDQLLSDLWYTLQENKATAGSALPVTPELRRQIRRSCPPPAWIDFRMAVQEP